MLGESVTRLRATTKSSPYAHGPHATGMEDWSTPSEHVFTAVAVAPTSSVIKYTDIASPIVSGVSLLFPNRVGLDIEARDRFIVRGQTWDVAGEPEEYISPFTGYVGGTVVHLKRHEDI